MAFSQSDNEDDYRYIRIVGYGGYTNKDDHKDVTINSTPVIVANDHGQNLNDTLKLGENDTLYKVNTQGLTYIKLKIHHEDHIVEAHPIVFKRHRKRIVIVLRQEGQLFHYWTSQTRFPFTPVKDVIYIDIDRQYVDVYRLQEWHYKLPHIIEDNIEFRIYRREGIRYISYNPPVFRLHPGHSMDSIGRKLEKLPYVKEVNPLICINCRQSLVGRGGPCWYIKDIDIVFIDEVTKSQAKEMLEEVGFTNVRPIDARKTSIRPYTNVYRITFSTFDGYGFLEKVDMLWKRNDVINIITNFNCPVF